MKLQIRGYISQQPLIDSVLFRIIAIRAMTAAAFTAVASFYMVFFGKHPIPIFSVVIAFFDGNMLFHATKIRL